MALVRTKKLVDSVGWRSGRRKIDWKGKDGEEWSERRWKGKD